MSSRFLCSAIVLFALAGCSHLPWHHPKPPAVQQSLLKSLSGAVVYDLPQPPPDAYLLVTLADVSKQDAPARQIAEERIQPVDASPVEFHLSYEPADLRDGVDFAVSARLQQGDKLLAITDERVSVLGHSGEQGPVKLSLKATTPSP